MNTVNLEFLTGDNHEFLVQLACRYSVSRKNVDPSWLPFLDQMIPELDEIVAQARATGKYDLYVSGTLLDESAAESLVALKMNAMKAAFRTVGHKYADLHALSQSAPTLGNELTLEAFSLSSTDATVDQRPVADVHTALRGAYCGSLALEAAHVEEDDRRQWLFEAFEGGEFSPDATRRLIALDDLIRADSFEAFCQKKHPTVKRFGAEGAEAMIPFMNTLIADGADSGVDRVVVGGMHRGRLNVLAHVAQKPLPEVFSRFLDLPQAEEADGFQGDVVYHIGHDGDRAHGGKKVQISLLPHPSHLLCVAPVALGRARAEQQERVNGKARVLPIMMHTDAAFAGQGLTSEVLQLTGLKGFEVAGAIHFVVNNRVGFTTSESEGRRTPYCTDIAKAYGIPVIHVNGSDPDAVVRAAMIAGAYRQAFLSDIVIDFNCYRRRGHNELDEPDFTHPLEQKQIARQQPVCRAYRNRLASEGLNVEKSDAFAARYPIDIAAQYARAQTVHTSEIPWLAGRWSGISASEDAVSTPATSVNRSELERFGRDLAKLPGGKHLHQGFEKFQERRAATLASGEQINWATAEALAFASLMSEGYNVRLTGQDAVRGTFTQRHLKWVDQTTGEEGFMFDQLGHLPGQIEAINSPLTEYGVLGFEYGYSLSTPKTLTLWEAQFGDFQNVAQPIIDQFIVNGEQKWNRLSGLVLSLPHGLEGGGPDHSTARPERFLSACADGNITVANCTTPANYFHVLRRQLIGEQRKPLVLFSPKQHLRSKAAVSRLSDMSGDTRFNPVLVDMFGAAATPDTIIFCSGRVYYDLTERLQATGHQTMAIVRLEQLYPLPAEAIASVLSEFPEAACIWVQEEPKNMGPWSFILDQFTTLFDELDDERRLKYIGRKAAASASTGSKRLYQREQDAYLQQVLDLPTGPNIKFRKKVS